MPILNEMLAGAIMVSAWAISVFFLRTAMEPAAVQNSQVQLSLRRSRIER